MRRQRMQTRLDAITHSIQVLTDAATDPHVDDLEHIDRGLDRLRSTRPTCVMFSPRETRKRPPAEFTSSSSLRSFDGGGRFVG